MSEFVSWPSIEGFHNVWKNNAVLISRGELVVYRSKIKLHGTNAGVRIDPDGTVTAQKRTSDVFVGADNLGFAAWVEESKAFFAELRANETIIIYGEWAGPGVQKGVAVSKIERKKFFVFGVYQVASDELIVEPDHIANIVFGPVSLNRDHPDIYVLPWEETSVIIDFGNGERTQEVIEGLNPIIEKIDAECPYTKWVFNVEGPGEGLVFYPIIPSSPPTAGLRREQFSRLAWKAKGESHRVVKDKNAVRMNAFVAESHKELAERFVTEQRLRQALQEACGGVADMHKTAEFLKWIGNDVRKESAAELEVAGLEWKQVAKTVNALAVAWFKSQASQITTIAA